MNSHVPELLPRTLGLAPSFGFGDRTGLATPGHLLALQRSGTEIRPIFAQQSIREMTRTGRTAQQVMDDALSALAASGWTQPHGADADHLKTPQDVDVTAAAGFTFFTIDPSDYVDPLADEYSDEELDKRFAALEQQAEWVDLYCDTSVELETGTRIEFSSQVCRRAALKYGAAVEHALNIARYIQRRRAEERGAFELELSVDESPRPTSLAEHYMIADQFRRANIPLISLAPRLPGDFEKGIDYRGDLEQLERVLEDHAAIARRLGPYKLSLHSGSDKLSIYPLFARTTRGRFHVKTAGTSYLEALRTVARHDVPLLREIIAFSRSRFSTDRATYHISAELDRVPPGDEITDARELEKIYLGSWDDVPAGQGFTEPGRQILHCTFGSVLTHPQLGPRLRNLLETQQATYTELLADHFERHLRALDY